MAKYASFGTLLKIGDGGGTETFTTIAQVQDITGPSLTQRTAEVTNHSSTAGYSEFVGTVLDGGEVAFDVVFDPADDTQDYGAGLIGDLEGKTARNFQVVWPDTANTTWSFTALVTSVEPNAPVDGALTASCTLLITGQPTLA